MENLIPEIIEWIELQPAWSVYFILFVVAYLENVIPPIPGDVMVVFGGYLVAEQVLDFGGLMLTTSIGSMMGFMSLYYLGYLAGDNIRSRNGRLWFLRFIKASHLSKTERWMMRWGQGLILVNRFLAGARSIISLVAGMSRLNPKRTAGFATLGAALWNLVLIGAGWIIGDNWIVIQQYLNLYGQFILALMLILITIRLGMYFYKRKNDETSSS